MDAAPLPVVSTLSAQTPATLPHSAPRRTLLTNENTVVHAQQSRKHVPDRFRNGLLNCVGFPSIIQLLGRKQIPIINHILLDQAGKQFIW